MKLRWMVGALRLREPLRISRSVMSERDVVTVVIEHEGSAGYGEVVTSVYYGLSVGRIERELTTAGRMLAGRTGPAEALFSALPAGSAGVRAALDAALHDLVATQRGIGVYELIGTAKPDPTPTAYTIGIMPIERAVATTQSLTGQGFTVLKVKLGSSEAELDRLAAIRAAAPQARILLDPNGSWHPDQAMRMLKAAADYAVDAVEQPIPPGTPDVLAHIASSSPVPVIADEDAATVDDVRTLGSRVHGVNVKLPKCGGIRAAREIIDIARESGVEVMLGCLVSSSLGIAPAVHLAGLARWIDLDGHLLLAHDPWTGIGGTDGVLRIDSDRGLGVRPVEAA